jgi:hypothetical protein
VRRQPSALLLPLAAQLVPIPPLLGQLGLMYALSVAAVAILLLKPLLAQNAYLVTLSLLWARPQTPAQYVVQEALPLSDLLIAAPANPQRELLLKNKN